MSKRAVLMMTFGSPEEITYEGVAEFSQIYAVGFVLNHMKFRLYMTITYELAELHFKDN